MEHRNSASSKTKLKLRFLDENLNTKGAREVDSSNHSYHGPPPSSSGGSLTSYESMFEAEEQEESCYTVGLSDCSESGEEEQGMWGTCLLSPGEAGGVAVA